MITNDFTHTHANVIQFYMDQYINTTNQIQLIMEKQSDLTKLIRELNDYQLLMVSRQNDLLRLLNECIHRNLRQPELYSDTTNQTHTPERLTSTNQRPLYETFSDILQENTPNNSTPNRSASQRYYPNTDPLPTPRTTRHNTTRFNLNSSSTPTTTTPSTPTTSLSTTTPSTTSSNDYANILIYSLLPDRTSRNPQTSTTTTTNLASTLLETFMDEFLNPVSRAPTEEQIQNGTTLTVYRNIQEPVNTSCPISLNVFQAQDEILQINSCNHNYSPSSLREWFRTNNHCPLCRTDIREI